MTQEIIRIRKYPNRRLYDTSRSAFITSDQLYSIVREGNRVEVIESATGTDITNIVLLNAIIDRDPSRILSIPATVFHAMVSGVGDVASACCGGSKGGGAVQPCQ
ncbi:MAG: hypothetical protein EXS01_06045 [Phycisphaerales bacterium]|nr:hypothetical protein [Phycisphaerales bacterium]